LGPKGAKGQALQWGKIIMAFLGEKKGSWTKQNRLEKKLCTENIASATKKTKRRGKETGVKRGGSGPYHSDTTGEKEEDGPRVVVTRRHNQIGQAAEMNGKPFSEGGEGKREETEVGVVWGGGEKRKKV